MSTSEPRCAIHPLLIRRDARFECFEDGICCADMHRLGPLDPTDVVRLRALGAAEAIDDRGDGEADLRCVDGRCVLLDGTRCSLHTIAGADAKPSVCRAFPFSVIATPLGGRVVTAHRCPCRTLGPRPPLDTERVEGALAGAMVNVREAPGRLRLAPRTTLSFAQWLAVEAPLIERLVRGDPPHEVLRIALGLPPLRGRPWREVAALYHARGTGPEQGRSALSWFGDGILLVLGDQPPLSARPWSAGFDRAERRTAVVEPPARILGDWLADLVWDLSWADAGSFAHARGTIGALCAIACAVARRLAGLGLRPDRAMAEALLVAEIGAGHPLWADAALQIPPPLERG